MLHKFNENFLTKGRSKVNLEYFDYLNSKEYLVTPEVLEYNESKMAKPMDDLILDCKAMQELGIVLNFQTKEITLDRVILPMKDISLTTSTIENAWALNNSIAQEPSSKQEATRGTDHILDTKYKKADLLSVVRINYTHLSLQD